MCRVWGVRGVLGVWGRRPAPALRLMAAAACCRCCSCRRWLCLAAAALLATRPCPGPLAPLLPAQSGADFEVVNVLDEVGGGEGWGCGGVVLGDW